MKTMRVLLNQLSRRDLVQSS